MQKTQQAARRLADQTRATVVALWARQTAGEITSAQFRTLAAAAVAQANTAGVTLADVGLAAEVTRHLRRSVAPLGLTPTDVQVDQDRMARDIDRITARTLEPEDQLGDWASSEPHLTVAATVQRAMPRHGIERWTRGLSGGSCPKCTGWADGVARPTSVPMARHVGCDCIQQPVFT